MKRVLALTLLAVLTATSLYAVDKGTRFRHPGWPGEFYILSHSITFCPQTQTYHFEFTFNERPEFTTFDEYRRSRHGFIIGVLYDRPDKWKEVAAVSLGVWEYWNEGNQLTLLKTSTSTYLGDVPYHIDGTTVRFSVLASRLGDPDGNVFCSLDVFSWGATSGRTLYGRSVADCIDGASTSSPAPPKTEATWGAIKELMSK